MDPRDLARQLADLTPQQRGALLTAAAFGLDHHLGIRWTWADAERVEGRIEVGAQHLQPYGLVHGGVYCALAEAACSIGAALGLLPRGEHAVGVENHTRFLRATRQGGSLTVTATPAEVSGRHHAWRAQVVDEQGHTCAEATVVVRALAGDATLAGQRVGLAGDPPG